MSRPDPHKFMRGLAILYILVGILHVPHAIRTYPWIVEGRVRFDPIVSTMNMCFTNGVLLGTWAFLASRWRRWRAAKSKPPAPLA